MYIDRTRFLDLQRGNDSWVDFETSCQVTIVLERLPLTRIAHVRNIRLHLRQLQADSSWQRDLEQPSLCTGASRSRIRFIFAPERRTYHTCVVLEERSPNSSETDAIVAYRH